MVVRPEHDIRIVVVPEFHPLIDVFNASIPNTGILALRALIEVVIAHVGLVVENG
jgi:hypothetical protein